MARPIEPTPPLEGKAALNFLEEKERIENLKPGDPEYKELKKRAKERKGLLKKNPNMRILSRGFR